MTQDRPTELRAAAPRPHVPRAVRTVIEVAFTALARVRGARAFHPRGRSFTATLTPLPGQPLAFLGTQPRPALLRVSNAAGLPARAPDVVGLGIRIPDGAAPGLPLDLLLSTSGEAPILRHILMPARGVHTRRYSSLLRYRHDGAGRLVGARYSGPPPRGRLRLADVDRAALAGELVFTLALAAPFGAWQPIAELRAQAPLPPEQSAALRFHPWNAAPQLHPIGALNHARAGAYDASQRTASSE